MSSGASKLARLTIALNKYWSPGFDIQTLAAAFWNVALLRDGVEVEFKSELEDVESELAQGYDTLHTLLEQYWELLRTKRYQTLQAPGDLIAEARK
jgi:hypothetical protein